jgi:hypothetical protein
MPVQLINFSINKISFSGKLKSGDKKHKGKFNIPNLSEENDPDEIDVRIFHLNYRLYCSFTIKHFYVLAVDITETILLKC